MNRPIYESETDRAEENAIADMICAAWSCSVVKLPVAYHLDRAILRQKEVVAWTEIKRRKRTLRQHDSVFLSMQKVFAAHNYHRVTGKPCLFIVRFDDCLAYADMLPPRLIEFRGRTDRGDWQDQEPVVMIPVDEFRPINCSERLRITIAPKDADDCARIVAQVGGLLERGIE